MMRRAFSVLVAAVVVAGISVVTVTPAAAAERVVQPHTGMYDCPEGATGMQTTPSSPVEAEYNDDLTVCDWGPFASSIGHKLARYSFKNGSPVVWAFYDTVNTTLVPRPPTVMTFYSTGIAPLFRKFAQAKHIVDNDWLIAPGETVWFSSLDYVGATPAFPQITAAWLVYNYEANKLMDLGTDYAKRIATTGYASKTRTFLWNCSFAAISTKKSLALSSDADPQDIAKSWLASAAKDGTCIDSYKALFPKKTTKVPSSIYMGKWFNTKTLTETNEIVEKIDKSAALTATVKGIFRIAGELH